MCNWQKSKCRDSITGQQSCPVSLYRSSSHGYLTREGFLHWLAVRKHIASFTVCTVASNDTILSAFWLARPTANSGSVVVAAYDKGQFPAVAISFKSEPARSVVNTRAFDGRTSHQNRTLPTFEVVTLRLLLLLLLLLWEVFVSPNQPKQLLLAPQLLEQQPDLFSFCSLCTFFSL